MNVFWITFITQTQAPPPPPASTPGGTTITGLGFGDLADAIVNSNKSTKMVQPQLHWCEYYQGKWSKRISSDINKYGSLAVDDDFDASTVRIWISKDGDESSGEGAVTVHLDFPPAPGQITISAASKAGVLNEKAISVALNPAEAIPMFRLAPNWSFRVTSKNCDLVLTFDPSSVEPMNPYDAKTVDATLFKGQHSLSAIFQNTFTSTGDSIADSTPTTEPILQTVNSFALLPCSNPVVPSPFLFDTTEPDYIEAGSLVSPFFYKDIHDVSTTDEMTFYVQPNLTEATVAQWTGWAVVYPGVNQIIGSSQLLGDLPVIAQVPVAGPKLPPATDPIYSIYPLANTTDWLTSPATTVLYDGAIVGQTGGFNTPYVPSVVAGKQSAPANSQVARKTSPATVLGKQGLAANGIRKSIEIAGRLIAAASKELNWKKTVEERSLQQAEATSWPISTRASTTPLTRLSRPYQTLNAQNIWVPGQTILKRTESVAYQFYPFFHPYVGRDRAFVSGVKLSLIQRLRDGGVPELEASDTLYMPQPIHRRLRSRSRSSPTARAQR